MGWNLYLLARYASSLRSLALLAGGLLIYENNNKELDAKNKSSYSQVDESHSVAQYLLNNSNELFSTFEM